METWRPVVGYDGIYEVSDFGRVRSLDSRQQGRILKGLPYGRKRADHTRYLGVWLRKNGTTKPYSVHQLVARAFFGPPPSEKHILNHKNGDKHDNRLCNLEWCTHSENLAHAYQTGIRRKPDLRGELHPGAKLTDDLIRAIKVRATGGESKRSIADSLGMGLSTIYNIIAGRRWKHIC